MAELTTVARPYAEAVARLAKEGKSWAAWSEALALMAAVATEPQVASLIGSPDLPAGRLIDLFLALGGEKWTEEMRNFLRLLVENRRLAALPEIVRLYEEMKAAEEGVLEAKIVTAYELTPEQMAALIAKLQARFGRKVSATQAVDPELIGGVVISVGDEVLDASVRGKIAEMAVTLKA